MFHKRINIFFIFSIIAGVFLAGCTSAPPQGGSGGQGANMLFFSESCPHCKNVEKFIEENKIKEKIVFEEKDINGEDKNREDLVRTARKCNMKMEEVAVPLYWDGSNCILGDENIINHFKAQTGTN